MINVALIGLKGHQGVVLSRIAARDDVRLAAVWDDEPGALERFRGNAAVDERTLLTPNLDELLRLEAIQVAVLCDENAARAEHLESVARRGWDILAEKPLAIRFDDLSGLRATIAATGVHLSMLLTMRFEAPYVALREATAGGAVGTPRLLSGQKSYRRGNRPAWQTDPARYGGTIPFIGIHPLDLLGWTSGCRISRVAAIHHNAGLPGAGGMEETAAVLFACDGGALGDVRLDYLRPAAAPTHGDDRIRLAGDEGVLEVIDGRLTLITAGSPPRELPLGDPGELFDDFLTARETGTPGRIPAADCFAVTELVLRAREAAERGVWIDL